MHVYKSVTILVISLSTASMAVPLSPRFTDYNNGNSNDGLLSVDWPDSPAPKDSDPQHALLKRSPDRPQERGTTDEEMQSIRDEIDRHQAALAEQNPARPLADRFTNRSPSPPNGQEEAAEEPRRDPEAEEAARRERETARGTRTYEENLSARLGATDPTPEQEHPAAPQRRVTIRPVQDPEDAAAQPAWAQPRLTIRPPRGGSTS